MMGWQCEHHHHHALVAGCVAENILGSLQASREIPIALGLALPNAAQHRIQLIDGLVRHQRTQVVHRAADVVQVNEEVRTREAE